MMKGNGKNAGALGAIVKGEKPYDQATVDTALAQFEDTAKKLPTLFPASFKGHKADGDYSWSAKVWDDKAGFEAHIASFGKVVTEAKAKIKDLDTLKATFPALGKECGGCHETYRVKNG
jgi:cytochrome c556